MQPSETRSIEDLLISIEHGGEPKYLLFYGHRPKEKGRVDSSCLSNWFPSLFVVDSETYPTAEHYMMAEKARLFGDEWTRSQILESSTPDVAKRLGREVARFDERQWVDARFEIVVEATYAKFSQEDSLSEYLISTGNHVLVEASPQDRIWGIGLSVDDHRATDPRQWKGLNLLGFALMEARQMLREDRQ